MDVNNCVEKLRRVFDRYSPEFTADIFQEVNLSVKRMDNRLHWDTIVTQINSRLNSWLLQQVRLKNYLGDITRARQVLDCVDSEEYVRYWLNDIEREFAPVAWDIYRS